MNSADHLDPVGDGQELQRVIQDNHRRIVDRDLADIRSLDDDRNLCIVCGDDRTAAVDHRRRQVDGDDAAIRLRDVMPHCEGGSAKRAAEVVAARARADVATSQRRDGFQRRVVARDRAPEHVGKDLGNRVIEFERAGSGSRRFENLVLRHIHLRSPGPARTGWDSRRIGNFAPSRLFVVGQSPSRSGHRKC